MRKTILLAAAIIAALGATAQADRQYTLCDHAKSRFCDVSALFEFDEASNATRTSETGPEVALFEPDGANVGNSATKKTGSYSLAHTAVANSFLQLPRTVFAPVTMNFWIYVDTLPSADTKESYLFSVKDENGNWLYPRVKLYRSGASTYVRYEVKQAIDDTVTYVQSGSALSTATWYMVTVGSYSSPTSTYPFQQTIWVQINAGTRATATVNNPPVAGVGTLYVGESVNTSPREYCAWKMDQLAFFPFVFSPGDVTALYNSGSGRAWPFTFNNN